MDLSRAVSKGGGQKAACLWLHDDLGVQLTQTQVLSAECKVAGIRLHPIVGKARWQAKPLLQSITVLQSNISNITNIAMLIHS